MRQIEKDSEQSITKQTIKKESFFVVRSSRNQNRRHDPAYPFYRWKLQLLMEVFLQLKRGTTVPQKEPRLTSIVDSETFFSLLLFWLKAFVQKYY